MPVALMTPNILADCLEKVLIAVLKNTEMHMFKTRNLVFAYSPAYFSLKQETSLIALKHLLQCEIGETIVLLLS